LLADVLCEEKENAMDLESQVARLVGDTSAIGENAGFTSALSDNEDRDVSLAASPLPLWNLNSFPLRDNMDRETDLLAKRMAGMHLSDMSKESMTEEEFQETFIGGGLQGKMLGREIKTQEDFEDWIFGKNDFADDPIDAVAPNEDVQAFVAGENFSRPPLVQRQRGPGLANTKDALTNDLLQWASKGETQNEKTKGIFTDLKNFFFKAYLYPAKGDRFDGRIPAAVLKERLDYSATPINRTDDLAIEALDGQRRFRHSHLPLRRLAGVSHALVYALDPSGSRITRSDFFRDRGTLQSAVAKVTFTHPETNESETWRLTFNNSEARSLRSAHVWATGPDRTMLVLRFDPSTEVLKEMVLLYKNSSSASSSSSYVSSSASTPLTKEGLGMGKVGTAGSTLAALVAKGTLFGSADIDHGALGANPEYARRVLGAAMSHLSKAYIKTDFASAAVAESPMTPGQLETLEAFAVACHEKKNELEDDDAVLAWGGELAGKIRTLLPRGEANGNATIVAAMRSLGSAYAAVHTCAVRGTPSDAHGRVAMFLKADKQIRSSVADMNELFFF
jgi:hypothetical protein